MNNRTNLPTNPLRRDGVSQRQRLTPALAPDQPQAAQVDEQTLADFLVLAYRLSKQVHYYKVPETPSSIPVETRTATRSLPKPLTSWIDGDWQDFFSGYTPVQIALISKIRPQSVKHDYDRLLNAFLKQPGCETLTPILDLWKTAILMPIQTWYQTLATYTPFRATIKGLVNTNLGDPINRIITYEQVCAPVLDTAFYETFGGLFKLPPTLDADSVPRLSLGTESQRDLDGIFQALFQVYRQIIHQAAIFLEASLSDRRDHPPHLALYIAMLDVLQPARDDLNRMTQRHLDFFYRKVLNLSARPAVPDYTHLLFELAKSQQEYKLAAGTRFKAGKDDTGVELFYALDQDMVVHRASVASLKGLFLASQQFPKEKPADLLKLLASPIVNSFDGKGEDFPKEQAVKAWPPFGGPQVLTSQTAQLESSPPPKGMPAQLGVAIASDVLLLQEGKRTLTLEFSLGSVFNSPKDVAHLEKAFEIYLSGEKEWILATADSSPAYIDAVTWTENLASLNIVVVLTAEVDPILPYDPNNPIPFNPDTPNLPLTLERPIPVLRLQLTTHSLDEQDRSAYHYFRGVTLSALTITVTVPEVRNLVVETDAGAQDAAKPFQPFGPQPKSGANVYIGSQEALVKRLTELTLHLESEVPPPTKSETDPSLDWSKIYLSYDSAHEGGNSSGFRDDFAPGTVTIDSLRQKVWHPATLPETTIFRPPDIELTDHLTELALNEFAKPENDEMFTPESQNGFLRLQLTEDFLHSEYPTVLARQVLAAATNRSIYVSDEVKDFRRQAVIGAYYRKSNGKVFRASQHYVDLDAEPILPKEPYTPVVRSIHLSYTAEANLSDCQIFRLYPFGGFEATPDTLPYPLFPYFPNEGELLIGIADLAPPTALPLLFQVAEETADTGLRRTEAFQLEWFYLKDNAWVPLGDRISSDTTHGLTRSGIVNLGIPEDISKAKTTILDPALHWVKVTMPARTRTVCHIIDVHSQAARVTFVDGGDNDPNYLATPLPAGSIAKLEKPQPEIKSIEQPYPSVEGRVQERPNHFYTRVSEHLRHKGRAVTIFDYERLVLEQFPDIYKVRCLNHGQFDDTTQTLFELAPGSVTVAVIPDVSQRATIDDLQPRVNINRLQTIETYLSSLSSSWAAIKVVNPRYEPIRVSFEVKFRSPYDANFGYYRRELERAIVGFLTPWTIDQGADISFGGKVYHSAILNFVEEQEYVDYVINFSLFHNGQDNLRVAIASTARSVLTSVPYNHPAGHLIEELKESALVIPTAPLAAGTLGYEPLNNLIIGPDDP